VREWRKVTVRPGLDAEDKAHSQAVLLLGKVSVRWGWLLSQQRRLRPLQHSSSFIEPLFPYALLPAWLIDCGVSVVVDGDASTFSPPSPTSSSHSEPCVVLYWAGQPGYSGQAEQACLAPCMFTESGGCL